MMRVDFLVPGFSKCGTTSLCSHLAKHPEVFIPEAKEPCFFAYNFEKGWQWYETFFKDAGAARILGEGSTFYTAAEFEDRVCERVFKYFPHVRLIFIARNPIARLESSFREQHHSGHKYGISAPYSIGQALQEFHNILDDTLYWQRINAYRRYVPDSQIHMLFLEDFVRNPESELARCFEFLGVNPTVDIESFQEKLNAGSSKLYDSRLWRLLRSHRLLNRLCDSLSDDSRDWLVRLLRLRKPFRGPVQWDRATLDRVLEEIAEDARRFLNHYGKPLDFWELVPKSLAA